MMFSDLGKGSISTQVDDSNKSLDDTKVRC